MSTYRWYTAYMRSDLSLLTSIASISQRNRFPQLLCNDFVAIICSQKFILFSPIKIFRRKHCMLYKPLIVSVGLNVGLPFPYIMNARINCSNVSLFALQFRAKTFRLSIWITFERVVSLMSWDVDSFAIRESESTIVMSCSECDLKPINGKYDWDNNSLSSAILRWFSQSVSPMYYCFWEGFNRFQSRTDISKLAIYSVNIFRSIVHSIICGEGT